MTLLTSWVSSANTATTEFPLNNLPYGVFSTKTLSPRCGVAIGDYVLDMASVEQAGLLHDLPEALCQQPGWNALMSQQTDIWQSFRNQLLALLAENSQHAKLLEQHLTLLSEASMHMPFVVSEFTDFYASRSHATNVGTMFRGAENALPPNWLHIPIGYNGRASSVVVSGTPITRPWGQLKSPEHSTPEFMPSRRFDIELEMGTIVGSSSTGPVTVEQANDMIFGFVLLNDWSARDIQAWEYQPLGPFQAKATATTISPWIVTQAALASFKTPLPTREVPLLPYLQTGEQYLYDIELNVSLAPAGKAATTICTTNYREMYYSAGQQLAHHSSSGCPMRTGDLLGSGTISGDEPSQRGSLLELSWGGKQPLTLDTGETRSFIEDGDSLTLSGCARGDGFTIGFGLCEGTLNPALTNPHQS